MGCTDPLKRGVGAPHQCPLRSVASYLIYADVRLRIPMTRDGNDRQGDQLSIERLRQSLVAGGQPLAVQDQICRSMDPDGDLQVTHNEFLNGLLSNVRAAIVVLRPAS